MGVALPSQPNPLTLDATLRDIHRSSMPNWAAIIEHVKGRPADAIYRAADAEFTGPERLKQPTRNLVRTLRNRGDYLGTRQFPEPI